MRTTFTRRATLGSWTERARLIRKARAVGSVVRLPFRLPQSSAPHPSASVSIGASSYIGARSWFSVTSPSARIVIGDGCVFGESLAISCGDEVTIGNGVTFSDRVTIVDQQHDAESWVRDALDQGASPHASWEMLPPEPIKIGDGCWFGVNVVVMPGVVIGPGCVVGSSSVVTRDVPPYTVVAGIPAVPIRRLGD